MTTPNQDDEILRSENASRGRKYMRLAWAFELMSVAAGIGVAYAQAFSVPHADTGTFLAVLLVFLMIALAEFAKIPLALATYSIRGMRRLLPLFGLAVVSLITFETAFNGIERQTHLMTGPVVAAHQQVSDLTAEIERLRTGAGVEAAGASVDELNAKRRVVLEGAVARAQGALDVAQQDVESSETRQLRAQLDDVLSQQQAAGDTAEKSRQQEQDSINGRLAAHAKGELALNQQMVAQLNSRMHAMPPRQKVIAEARKPFVPQIADLQARLEASIQAPSPEAKARVEAAEGDLKRARAELRDFAALEADRHQSQLEQELKAEQDRAARGTEIKALEADLIDVRRALTDAAEGSQMHRWAAFTFNVAPEKASEAQVKRVSAVFGTIIGIAVALGGSSIAMVAQWFRNTGIRPRVVTVTETVEVEREVERVVTEVVEKPIDNFVYVPIAPTMAMDELLDRLPPEIAADLRKQMAVDTDADSSADLKEAA